MTDAIAHRLLVIEDDEIARSSLARALTDRGYQVDVAIDGQTGLDIALATQPDLIISDNLMPILSGTELLDKLRTDTWGKNVPFILLTSQFSMEAVNNSLEAGQTDFLIKDDTTLADIIQAIERRLAT